MRIDFANQIRSTKILFQNPDKGDMAHLLPTVFPRQRFYGFDPLPGLVGPQHAVYDYDWPAMPWAATGADERLGVGG